jgi:arginine utilization protein RocB
MDKPFKETFTHQDGVSLREYFEAIYKELRQQFDDRVKDAAEKCDTKIEANDRLYQAKFLSSDNAVREAFAASQQAITKSELGQEKRSDAVYVSITALQKALAEVISRGEFNLSTKLVDEKYDILKKNVSDILIIQTRFMTVEAYDKRHEELQRQVNDLRETRSEVAGGKTGGKEQWAMIISIISLIATIIAIFTFAFGVIK